MNENETLGALKQLYEAFIKMNNGCYPIDRYPAALYKAEAMDRANAVLKEANMLRDYSCGCLGDDECPKCS
jgi:hypothetical protein